MLRKFTSNPLVFQAPRFCLGKDGTRYHAVLDAAAGLSYCQRLTGMLPSGFPLGQRNVEVLQCGLPGPKIL